MTSEDRIHAALLELAPLPQVAPGWDDVVRRASRGRRRRRRAVLAAVAAAAVLPAVALGGLRLIAGSEPDLHGSGKSDSLGLSADFTADRARAFHPVGRDGPVFGGLRWTLRIRQEAVRPTTAYLVVFARPSSLRFRLCAPCRATNAGVLVRRGLWPAIGSHQKRHPPRIEVRAPGGTLQFRVTR